MSPAAKAIEVYASVFGARVVDVTKMGDVIAHAVLAFELGLLTLSDPLPSYGLRAHSGSDDVSASFAVYVKDVDAVVSRFVAAGAVVREPLATFVSGDRYASLRDPFGVRWAVMTRFEDLSPEESARRVAEWAKAQK